MRGFWRRGEAIPKSKVVEEDVVDDPLRRKVIFGIAAAGTAGVAFGVNESLKGIEPAVESEIELPPITEHVPLAEVESGVNPESLLEASNSKYFDSEAVKNESEYRRDIDVVLDRTEVVAAIENNFKLTKITSPKLRAELEDLAIGVAIAESRLDPNALNKSSGAFSFLQIMPETWESLAKEGESRTSLEDVVKVAARLMEQTYVHLTTVRRLELDYICTEFFDGDAEAMELDFLAPVCVNAYNTGMGSLDKIIDDLLKEFPTKQSTGDFGQGANIMTGRDLFYSFSHQAAEFAQRRTKEEGGGGEEQVVVRTYGPDSLAYTYKVYAARKVYREHVPRL